MTDRAETDAILRHAFFEVAITLLGLFEVYDAKPLLVEHAATELDAILREHLGQQATDRSLRGKLALERLLDELERELIETSTPIL